MPIPFDPRDPFPLLPHGSAAARYAEAQTHADEVDAWLGLRIDGIESGLSARALAPTPAGEELWIGRPPRVFQTPYTELREILARLSPRDGATIVDLGAAYGRLAFVVGRHYPRLHFIGIEVVEERVREARRCLAAHSFARVEMREGDLARKNFIPPPADYYFAFDFGSQTSVDKCLEDLRRIALARQSRAPAGRAPGGIVVVARGRRMRDTIERGHPWLATIVTPEHFDHYSIYRSA